jgi:hypothetical protein
LRVDDSPCTPKTPIADLTCWHLHQQAEKFAPVVQLLLPDAFVQAMDASVWNDKKSPVMP